MLCIEVWCEDSTEHIQVSSRCDEPIQISCEVDELINIWSNLCEQIEISSEDASDHIEIYSDWYSSIEIWSSFVCTIDSEQKYLILSYLNETNPPDDLVVFISDKYTSYIDVISNLNWDLIKK